MIMARDFHRITEEEFQRMETELSDTLSAYGADPVPFENPGYYGEALLTAMPDSINEERRAAGKQEGSKRQKVSAPEKESGPKEKQPIPKSPSL